MLYVLYTYYVYIFFTFLYILSTFFLPWNVCTSGQNPVHAPAHPPPLDGFPLGSSKVVDRKQFLGVVIYLERVNLI